MRIVGGFSSSLDGAFAPCSLQDLLHTSLSVFFAGGIIAVIVVFSRQHYLHMSTKPWRPLRDVTTSGR